MKNNISPSQRHQVLFHGRAGEYFSIWLVNIFLTAITLGIYSAWATVRSRRYFYGNTEIAGDRFDYHARPVDILKGRLLVFAGIALFLIIAQIQPFVAMLFALVFCALIPWVIIRSWRYNAIMSSFRGVRFNYHCRVGRAYWVMLFAPMLMILALYFAVTFVSLILSSSGRLEMMIPMAVFCAVVFLGGLAVINGIVATMHADLYINNMAYGQLPFNASLNKNHFIKIALCSMLIMLPFIIVAVSLVGSILISAISSTMMGGQDPDLMRGFFVAHIGSFIMAWLVLLVGVLICNAYSLVAQRNALFNTTKLGGNLRLQSTMRTMPYIGLMLTNSLIVIFTLGFGAPLVEIRLARYLANSTALEGDIALQDVTAHHESTGSAVAEEAVAAFELNPGI